MRLLATVRPAKLFAFGGILLFLVTVISMLVGFAGTPAVDLASEDHGVFGLGSFCALSPLIFLLLAGVYFVYSKTGRGTPNPTFVWLHFLISFLCACVAIYLLSNRVDLPVPDWKEILGWRLVLQVRLFLISRFIFALAQALFVMGLLLSAFFRPPPDPRRFS